MSDVGLVAVVTVLALYRLTLLVTADAIFAPQRERAIERHREAGRHRLAALLECPWCVSVWLAPPVVASALLWSSSWAWWLAAGSMAASAATGALATFARP